MVNGGDKIWMLSGWLLNKLLNISLCFILTLNFGYSQSIKRNVISSFGASSNTTNSIVETTFGQPPNIGTITDGNNYVRQGFQQPLYNFITTPGCTDSTAINYNPLATVDDGSCIYFSYDHSTIQIKPHSECKHYATHKPYKQAQIWRASNTSKTAL